MKPVNESHVTPAAALPRSEGAAPFSGWTMVRIVAVVIGALVVLVSVGLLGAGGTALWADRTQRDAGYVTTSVHHFSTSRSALATERTDLGSAGAGWLFAPSLLDRVRIRVTPVSSGTPLFVGIGPSADVDRYLAGVSRTVITEFFEDKVEAVDGGPPESSPAAQSFWVASDSGPGGRTVEWDPTKGSWTVVVMNVDARPGIDVEADLGARLPAVLWIAVGVLILGAVLLLGGVLLITGSIRRRRASAVPAA